MNRRAIAALALLAPLAAQAKLPAIARSFQLGQRLTLAAVLGAYRHAHDAEVTAVRYLPGGKGMVTAATDLSVRLWDALGDPVAIFAVGRGRVHALAVSPDGSLVAAGGASLVVTVHDVAKGDRRAALAGHTSNVITLDFAPDGRRLVSGGRDQTLRLWDVPAGKALAQIATRATPVAAAFSIDGGLVIALLGDGTVLRWEPATNKVTTSEGRTVKLDAGAFSADRSLLIAAGQRRIWLVDTGTGALAEVASRTGEVTSIAVSADGSRAVTGDHDGRLSLWDPAARARLWTVRAHPVEITAVDLSPDGRRALTGSRDTAFREWDTRTGQLAPRLAGHESPAYAVVQLASGELASAGGDGSVRLWDPQDGEPRGRLAGMSGGVFALAEAPGGRLLTGGDDGKLRLWEKGHPRPLEVREAHRGGVFALAVAGDHVATAGEDGHVRVFDLAQLRELRAIPVGNRRPLRALALTPDGRRAATAGDDGLVYRVDLATGAVTHGGDAKRGPILALAYSPDGARLAVGGDDGAVLIDGAVVGRHDDAVRALAFCPRGDCLVSGGRDGLIRYFTGGAESDRLDLGPSRDAPRALAFTRDGRLVCGTERGVLLVFRPR